MTNFIAESASGVGPRALRVGLAGIEPATSALSVQSARGPKGAFHLRLHAAKIGPGGTSCPLRATSLGKRGREVPLQRCRGVLVGLGGSVRVALHGHPRRRVAGSPLGDVVGHPASAIAVTAKCRRAWKVRPSGTPGVRPAAIASARTLSAVGRRIRSTSLRRRTPPLGPTNTRASESASGLARYRARCRASSSTRKAGAASVRRLCSVLASGSSDRCPPGVDLSKDRRRGNIDAGQGVGICTSQREGRRDCSNRGFR